ncbi:DNA polymerase-4 [Hathewaya proteolytica DSM 3090]|uniref:DNA polymerase IV n=1 Tax=Hathewaya proteolytica DSM 3090 TaxID=1121331 RepID=A0A1M6QLF3_9CLOT|nr:DNA polymerase IV [Hathewaya proteolytica]SHK21071.1 DNA polymerase-4 [Hathewaya proteolytica DSM 3090]
MDRAILHCDLNNFYASVECMLHPELKNEYIIVGGSEQDRHGIVLAKNNKAKACGIKTGEAVWQARQKCKGLVVVPPHHDEYAKYSKLVQNIYYKYTNLIEPFGIDECWLDVTGSTRLFGKPSDIAFKIKEEVKSQLGLTISVGVSYNKIFAKLGSDLKKPDAVTEISSRDFREKIWWLPASSMIGIGKSTKAKLDRYCIHTIGDLAKCNVDFLIHKFGKVGYDLWCNANGQNRSPVKDFLYSEDVKSVGHGTTTSKDLSSNEQVWKLILYLSESVASQLKNKNMVAGVIQLEIKDNEFSTFSHEGKIAYSTDSSLIIAKKAYELFIKSYPWKKNIRALTVRTKSLQSRDIPLQLDLLCSYDSQLKQEKAEYVVNDIRKRFGNNKICFARLLK